jgi:hypothetical protein
MIPARELKRLGHEAIISPWPRISEDVYCFSKHFNSGDYFSVRGIKEVGKKTVFHCCDNHFDNEHADHYRRMLETVDVVIASTEEMASVIKVETGRDATIIYDSYEFDEKEPSFEPNGPLKLLWFGHPSNLNSLLAIWPKLNDNVMIVTAKEVQGKIKMDGEAVPIVAYSEENLLKALDMCDAVIIPSEMGARQKVKSPNRLIEAVRRGKYVLADSLPSYMPFDKWMWLGDIPKGIEMLKLQEKDTIEGRIRDAQAYIRETHDPELIGKQWEEVLSE